MARAASSSWQRALLLCSLAPLWAGGLCSNSNDFGPPITAGPSIATHCVPQPANGTPPLRLGLFGNQFTAFVEDQSLPSESAPAGSFQAPTEAQHFDAAILTAFTGTSSASAEQYRLSFAVSTSSIAPLEQSEAFVEQQFIYRRNCGDRWLVIYPFPLRYSDYDKMVFREKETIYSTLSIEDSSGNEVATQQLRLSF